MSAAPLREVAATKVCRGPCGRELPATDEYFHRVKGNAVVDVATPMLRGKCKRCKQEMATALERKKTAVAQAVKSATGSATWRPRMVGEGGPEGGYTEHPDDGYRFMCVPDSHGRLIDWEAAEALLAFMRYWRPVRVFGLGDHVDFEAFSRFDGPSDRIERLGKDLSEWFRFATKMRESAPEARIEYHKGNHEHRLQRWRWKHPEADALLKLQGMDLPTVLKLGDFKMEWVESGTTMVNAKLMVKHGHMVRSRSGYTATGELERNGVTGISGHTHRLGQVYKRNRTGIMTWVESGCICHYDPEYMEGQTSDWCQGLSFGTISLRGNGFSVHTAPIVKGRVKALGVDISA